MNVDKWDHPDCGFKNLENPTQGSI